MGKTLRIITILIIMMNCVLPSDASDFRREWKAVESMIEQDLPESALEKVQGIFKKADAKGNDYQMLKSCVFMAGLGAEYREDYYIEAFDCLNGMMPKLSGIYEPLGWAILGNCYREYYQNSRYRIQQNERLETPSHDVNLWDEQTWLDTIYSCLYKSVTISSDLTAKTAFQNMDGLINPGNEEGVRLRPSLLDALLINAVCDFESVYSLTDAQAGIFKDVRLYGSSADFLQLTEEYSESGLLPWNLDIMARLARLRGNDADYDLRASTDLERFEVLMSYYDYALYRWLPDNGEAGRKLFSEGLLQLGESYFDKTPQSALIVAEYADLVVSKGNDAELMDICRKFADRWPDSEGAVQCRNIIQSIRQPELRLHITSLTSPDGSLLGITHKNISEIYFKCVPISDMLALLSNEVTPPEVYRSVRTVAEWRVDVDDPGDCKERNTLVQMPSLPVGKYCVIASSDTLFDSRTTCVESYDIELHSFAFTPCIPSTATGGICGFTVDRITGKPLAGCKYQIWTLAGPYYDRRRTECVASGITNADGIVSVSIPLSAIGLSLEIEISKGLETMVSSLYLPPRYDRPEPLLARIYTDRYTYRPGDTVNFNCIVYQDNGYSIGSTVANTVLDLELVDVNWQTVDTLSLTTDKFGTASGSFVIPRDLLPGRFNIRLQSADDDLYSNCVINVEEFRQPVFMVEMGSDGRSYIPGDTAVVSGMAVTYTGVPVSGAKVSYTVEYVEPWRFMFINNGLRQIAAGDTETGTDGTFSVSFTASSGLAHTEGRESLDFKITAKVTDINGETHTAVTYVTAGRAIPYLSVGASQVYTDVPSFRILLENAAGDFLAGKVNVVVERLGPVDELRLDVCAFDPAIGEYKVSDEIRGNFPLYDFDKKGNDPRPIECCVYSATVDTEAGSPYILGLPESLENGIYRVCAGIDGVEEYDTVFFTSVLPDSKVMPDDRLLLAEPVSKSYSVGEKAEILVGSAFAGTPVYYIIESRFGFVQKGVLYPEGGVTKLSFDVLPEMKGGVSVQCAAIKELVSSNISMDIDVPYTDKELDIKLVTFRDMLEPDKTETWSINIKDSEGKPVEAALTLSMYDSALDVYGVNYWTFSPWNSIVFGSKTLINQIRDYRFRSKYLPSVERLIYDGPHSIYPAIVSPFDSYRFNRRRLLTSRGLPVGSLSKNSISMEEFEGLGITTVDEALQGRIAGLDLVPDNNDFESGPTMHLRGASSESAAIGAGKDDDNPFDNIALRTDLNPTAFFIPNLRTDSNGVVSFSFTTPQLLTKWNFQGIAHTVDLKSAVFKQEVTTRKQLMLQPRAPRFVRQGDELNLSARLSNVSDADVIAKVRLELFDAVSGKSLDIISGAAACDVSVPSGGSSAVSYLLRIPNDVTAITYRMTAATDSHSDGQQEIIPVLSSRTVVTESVSLFNNGKETRNFELKVLSENLLSESVKDLTLTLEYTPSPIWYAIQALPYLEQVGNPSNEWLFHRYFADALSSHIIATRPAIGRMLDKWAAVPISEWQTQLDRNEDLKQTLLRETPWVLDSKDEKENLRHLAEAYAKDRIDDDLESALSELLKRREPRGGWSWISGYEPDMWVTNTIIGGIAQLVDFGCISLDDNEELREAVTLSLHWMDNQIKDYFSKNNIDRKTVKTVSPEELDWLYVHAVLKNIPLASGTEDIHQFLANVAVKEDSQDMSLYKRASMALLMSATGNERRAKQLVNTLIDRSLYDDEQGRWWRDNTGGYLWHQAPVETQSRIIQALLSVGDRQTEAAECGRWLLKQRQTTHWATSPATAQAVIALLRIGDLQGASLDAPAVSYITIADETIKAGGVDTDAGYIIRKWREPSDVSSMGKVSVRTDSPEIGWGALSIQYTEDMDNVRYSENGISLKRTLYRVDEKSDGAILHAVSDGESLHVGDRLRIRIELGCDRNLEYVQLKDMRAASFEPVSTRAGFSYNFGDDLRSYVVPENASQVFYIDRLERGSYIIEYDVYAEQAGTFNSGIVSAQCMYAPEFRSTASSSSVKVESAK